MPIMTSVPTLSVAVPNFNHAQFLPECLESLLRQRVQPLEIIVIDDASTDNSVPLLEKFSESNPRITLHRNEKNVGVVATMNRALDLVNGQHVFLIGADDRALPGYFEKTMRLLAGHPGAGLCFSDPASFNDQTGKVSENRLHLSEAPVFFSPDELMKLARRKRLLIPGNCIFRTSALRDAGGFLPELKWHCDFFASNVVALRHGACYVPEPLVQWRAVEGSYMTSGLREAGPQQAVVRRLLELLHSPAYRDVLPRFQTSGALAFTPRATRAILADKQFWPFINLTLLRRALPMEIFWRLPYRLQTIVRRLLGK